MVVGLFLPLRNLGRNPQRTLATGLAVTVGVAALMFADSWSRGVRNAITEYAVQGRLGAMQIHRSGYMDRTDLYPLDLHVPAEGKLVERVREVPGVSGVSPRIRFSGTISSGRDETMFLATAVDPANEWRACPRFMAGAVQKGRMLEPGDESAIVIGTDLARSLRLSVGDPVTLQATGASGRIGAIDSEVVGIAESTLPDENKWMVVLPIGAGQRLLDMDGRATSLVVGVDDVQRATHTVDEVTSTLGPLGDFEVHGFRQLGMYFERAIRLFSFALGFLLVVLSILVLLVIANTATLAASERGREVATLAALGARRTAIRRLFIAESATLGVIGAFVGVALGAGAIWLAARYGIPFKPPNQPEVLVRPRGSPPFAAACMTGAVVVAVLASVVPAWAMARRNPARVLRG